MSRERPPRRASSGDRGRLLAALACLGCVALAIWVQRRALGAYFSLDDLVALERARGLVPPQPIPWWRWISGPVYFGLARHLFGAEPGPYHAVTVGLHGVNVALVFRLARRWGAGVLVASLAAIGFGASRLFEVVLDQAVGIEVLLALGFTLLAFSRLDPARPRTWPWAAVLFAAALLSKESVMLMPLVLLLPLVPGAPLRRRALAVSILLAEGAVLLVALGLAHAKTVTFGGEAYATGYGINLFQNLMTYASWTVDFRRLAPDLGGMLAASWMTGLPVCLVVAAVVWVTRRSSLRAAAGAMWYVLGLAPVLPFLHHTYQQYLYTAFPGLGIVAAEGLLALGRAASGRFGAPEPRRTRPAAAGFERWAALAAIALALVYAVASDRMLGERWTRRVPELGLLTDPQLRKSELVRTVSTSLTPWMGRAGIRLAFIEPAESQQRIKVATGQRIEAEGPVSGDLMTQVLDQGRALQVLHPGVDSVVFVERWTPALEGFDIVVNSPDGRCMDLGSDPGAQRRLVSLMLDGGFARSALAQVAVLRVADPGDTGLWLLEAQALAAVGRRDEAVGSSRVDLQACKLEYSIVSPK